MIREFAQLNHENQIHQALQVAALSITTNPYQGLKLKVTNYSPFWILDFQLPLIPIRD